MNDPVFQSSIEILGPVEAPLPKISGYYRWQILLKGLKINLLHAMVHKLLFEDQKVMNHRAVTVAIDVDPIYML
jgi:primosomal protein N' (replication factor Y)